MSSPVTANSSPVPIEDIKPVSASASSPPDVDLASESESKSKSQNKAKITKKVNAPAARTSKTKRAVTMKKAKAPATVKTTKAKTATKKVSGAAVSKPVSNGRPSWKDIIKECIVANKDDARVGVSRTTIKKVSHFCCVGLLQQ